MPYYNRDPKRDHNFDNHPHAVIKQLRARKGWGVGVGCRGGFGSIGLVGQAKKTGTCGHSGDTYRKKMEDILRLFLARFKPLSENFRDMRGITFLKAVQPHLTLRVQEPNW